MWVWACHIGCLAPDVLSPCRCVPVMCGRMGGWVGVYWGHCIRQRFSRTIRRDETHTRTHTHTHTHTHLQGALQSLAVDEDNQKKIKSLGAIPLITKLLSSRTPEVQSNAAGILFLSLFRILLHFLSLPRNSLHFLSLYLADLSHSSHLSKSHANVCVM